MKILESLSVPTGNILRIEGEKGELELLSIGDYGKQHNIKADFLGYTREIEGVPSMAVAPLEEKWVITISTQYGCSSKCKFCDAPKVGAGKNATYNDLKDQVMTGLMLHPEVKETERLNIHYARMGEPSWNPAVLEFTRDLKEIVDVKASVIHPVFTTMCPKGNKHLESRLLEWAQIKNEVYKGEAGLQLSINSTSDEQREDMFGGSAESLDTIARIGRHLPKPKGRKYTLNFALADGYEVDAERLRQLFDPANFMVKITPLHATEACCEQGIKTTGGYETYLPYKEVESKLKEKGFDVLVFIPSKEEDESRITCGNVILSGSKVKKEKES